MTHTRTWIQDVRELAQDLNFQRRTSFNELVTAYRTSELNIKPTWGISSLRDSTETTGTGAAIAETGGEIKLSTGTTSTGTAKLQTKQRGQYQAGTEGEVGIGVRMPVAPTGTQYAEWGYFDDQNGFGHGIDANGFYLFRLTGGTKTKILQEDFNFDKLDGTGESGITLDLAAGNIFQINFVWYGYGEIKFYLNLKANNIDNRILVHALTVDESLSVIDPNQPLTINVYNGGTTDTNLDVYVGGRQFSVVNGTSSPQLRTTSIEIANQTITTTSYTAVAAIRKKATFNGRNNSVFVFTKSLQILTDNAVSIMIDYGGSVTGGTWGTPSDILSNETAIEINTTFTSDTPNTAVDKILTGGEKNSTVSASRQERQIFGDEDILIIYAKKKSVNDASIDLVLDVEEQW